MSIFESLLLQSIPAPEVIRDRLAQLASERLLLKALLRLSQRKDQARERLLAQQQAAQDRRKGKDQS